MEDSTIKQIMIISLSFLVGMILTILPLPQWAVWARPEWVFIILIFWVISAPWRVGIVAAFIVGLVMDLLTGTLLGQHALAFLVVAFLLVKFHPQLKSFPLWQQLGMIFILTLLELALQYWVMGLSGTTTKHWGYWLPALTSTIIWPWFCVLLRNRQDSVKI